MRSDTERLRWLYFHLILIQGTQFLYHMNDGAVRQSGYFSHSDEFMAAIDAAMNAELSVCPKCGYELYHPNNQGRCVRCGYEHSAELSKEQLARFAAYATNPDYAWIVAPLINHITATDTDWEALAEECAKQIRHAKDCSVGVAGFCDCGATRAQAVYTAAKEVK